MDFFVKENKKILILILVVIVVVVGIFLLLKGQLYGVLKSIFSRINPIKFASQLFNWVNPFQATVAPGLPLSEDSGLDLSEVNLESLLPGEEQEEGLTEETQEQEAEITSESNLTLAEIQEKVDEIAEKVGEIRQEVDKLLTLAEIQDKIDELREEVERISQEVEKLS